MPLTLVAATASFPIVMGLGGLLTFGGFPHVVHHVALIPALLVLGVILAFASSIMREASAGISDVPPLPTIGLRQRLFPIYAHNL